MTEKQKELNEKFSKLIQAGLEESSINNFFSSLSDQEYEDLIIMFEEGGFSGMSEDDREKVIGILYSMEGL